MKMLNKGFTLIEILIVVAMLAIMTALAQKLISECTPEQIQSGDTQCKKPKPEFKDDQQKLRVQ